MAYHADLAAFSAAGELVLVVEVKSRRGASREWATQVHGNLLGQGTVQHARYFLLALPDRFYFWKDGVGLPTDSSPSYEADASGLLRPYIEAAGVRPEEISHRSLEILVASFLHDMMAAREPWPWLRRDHPWVLDSGLFDALRGGRIAYEVAA